MRDDRELFYAAGEMTDADLLAFEASLSDSSKREVSSLKQAFSDLKLLNESIPEPQISFERIRHAIEAAPAPKRVMPWLRWSLIATPIGALAIVAVLISKSNVANTPIELSPSTTPIAVAATETPDMPSARPNPEVKSTVAVKKASPVTVAVVDQPVRRPSRRHSDSHRLVARLSEDFPRASAGLPKNATPAVSEAAPAIDSAMNSAARGGASPALSGTGVELSGESVVVVTSTPDSQTGANTAVEVSKQSDVVLGG